MTEPPARPAGAVGGQIIVDGRWMPFERGDSVALAILRAGEVPGRGGTLCLAGDCGNCLAQVEGIAYVRTCQTAARPGLVVTRHPPDGLPPLPGSGAVAAAEQPPRRRPAVRLPGPARMSALPRASMGLSLRRTVLALVLISLLAALVVDRFQGFGGPWLWNFDLSLANYPFASYFHEALAKGSLPFWNDRVGMGFPLYAEGQIGALYPPNWLIYQLPPLVALDVARVLHLVLAGVGAGLIVLRLTGSCAGAITTAIVAVLCGGIASKLEWTQVVTVYGWMPWVLLPLLWRRPSPGPGLVALAGVFWGIQALGGHPPYWVLTGIAAVVILLAQSPNRRALGRIVLFGLVGVGVGAVQLIPTFLITTLSSRAQGVGPDALFEYSATPFDFLAVAFANAFVPAQGSSWDLYQSWYPGGSVWSTLEVYAYVGLPALALAAVGLLVRRARPVLILAIVMVAIPIIGVLQPGVWAAIPGLNGLRHPIRAYLLLDLALAIGAGVGVARLGRRVRFLPAAVVVGVALGGYLFLTDVAVFLPSHFGGLVRAFWPYVPAGQEGAIRDLAVAALTSFWPIDLEVLLAAAVLYLMRRREGIPAVRVAAVALVALPLVLLTPAINQSLPSSAFTINGTSLANAVKAVQPGQVLTLNEPFYSGFPTGLADVGARDPHVYTSQFGSSLRLQSSEDLIANLRAAGPTSPLALAVGVDTVVAFNGPCGGREVATDTVYHATICRNDGALRPPYWVPASAVLAKTGGGLLPTTPIDAIVDPARAITNNVPATLTSWDTGSASIKVDAPAEGYVYIDRTWWPGWQLTVDGASVAPARVWGGQLVAVSAGTHAIEERFVPWDAGLGFLLTLATIVAVGVWAWRRRRVVAPVGELLPRASRFPVPRMGTRITQDPWRNLAIANRVKGANLWWTVFGLVSASLLAALVADRFAGFGGPWLWNYDMAPGNFPLASFFHENLVRGSLPLWDDRLGIGYPRYAEGQIGALYPPNWLIYLLPPLQALDVSRILHLTLAGVGTGAVVLRLSGSRLGAVSAALVAVLCGGIASKLEWTQTVVVFGWMPWVILPLLWRRPEPTRGMVALAGILWGVQALGGHPPYWALTGISATAIILATSPSRRGLVRTVGFGLVGIAIGAVQLVPTVLLTAFSGRGQGLPAVELFQFSATPFDFLGIAFANALVPTGSPSWDLLKSWYPGGTWAILEGYAYVGLPALALAAIGLRTRRARPLLIVGFIAIVIPVIGMLQPSIWAQLPFVSGLRHPVRAYLVLDLVLAVGAGLGIARLGRSRSLRAPIAVVALAGIGYVLVAGMVVLLPSIFDGLSSGFTDPALPRSLALDTLARPWPLLLELVVAGLTIWLVRRRLATPAARGAAVGLVALPLALLVPSMNQALPASSFSLDDTSIVQAVRAQSPHRVVSIAVPFYGGFPDQLKDGFADIYVQASLPLRSPTDLLGTIWGDPSSPLAPAVGIDTEVVFGRPCIVGREVAFDQYWNAHICHLDNATKPPYWVPTQLVGVPANAGTPGLAPVDVAVDPNQMIAAAVPAGVRTWDTGHAVIDVTATQSGYLFIDRAWWSGWQVTVDGTGATPLRAFGGQLVRLSPGHHVVEEHLFLVDVVLGGAVSAAMLTLLAAWFALTRRRHARALPPKAPASLDDVGIRRRGTAMPTSR